LSSLSFLTHSRGRLKGGDGEGIIQDHKEVGPFNPAQPKFLKKEETIMTKISKIMALTALITLVFGMTVIDNAVAGQSSGDISYPEKIAHVMSYIAKLQKAQPDVVKAFFELHHAAVKPGTLDTKVKELISLAISVVTHCDACIAAHTSGALNAGATDAEIMEALSVSILMGGGPAIAYATHAVEAMEQFKKTEK